MEIRTTLKDFSEKIKYYHLPPETYLRVIIDTVSEIKDSAGKNKDLPVITPEEQRHFLNLISDEYYSDASQEVINIIENSHMNTEMPDMK